MEGLKVRVSDHKFEKLEVEVSSEGESEEEQVFK